MLPNLKILICGIVFGLLLFAITGAGVMLPDSYSRVGEVPQIGRPMMQRMIADEPAQAQFYTMTVARRSEELERLRERAVLEVVLAPGQPETDLPKPAVVENPVSEGIVATDEDVPASQPSKAPKVGADAAPDSLQIRPTDVRTDASSDEPEPLQVATLPPLSPDTDVVEQAPSLAKIPLPPLRPTARINSIHRRSLHRPHRVAQAEPDTYAFGQNLFLRPPLLPR